MIRYRRKKSKLLRDTYYDIFSDGDFIEEYTHIKDSLNLEYSHHSIGIQLADYIAGCTVGILRQYVTSIEFFNQSIRPNLRTYRSQIFGAGVIEVPTNQDHRDRLIKILRNNS